MTDDKKCSSGTCISSTTISRLFDKIDFIKDKVSEADRDIAVIKVRTERIDELDKDFKKFKEEVQQKFIQLNEYKAKAAGIIIGVTFVVSLLSHLFEHVFKIWK